MSAQILETNNYSKFELLSFNRDVKKTRHLEQSMRNYGFLTSCPIIVETNGNGKLKIKQGHHRFFVARNLGIPVKYLTVNEPISIYEIERTANPWSMQDYLDSYSRERGGDYVKVREYCKETGMPVNLAISILAGQTAGTHNCSEAFKTGEYKSKRNQYAESVKQVVLCLKENGVKFYNVKNLIQAISKIVFVKEFDPEHMKGKIKNFACYMERKSTVDQYLEMLEDIYNRQSRVKIPLKFLSEEAAKKRNVAKR